MCHRLWCVAEKKAILLTRETGVSAGQIGTVCVLTLQGIFKGIDHVLPSLVRMIKTPRRRGVYFGAVHNTAARLVRRRLGES